MNYSNFDIEDFLADDRFVDWANDNCSEEEREFWRLLLLANPHLQDKIERSRTLVRSITKVEAVSEPVSQDTVDEIWDSITDRIRESPNSVSLTRHSRKRKLLAFSMAAVFVVATCATVTFLLFKSDNATQAKWYSYSKPFPDFVEVVNVTDQSMKVELQDGTTVLLESNSRLKYKKDYNRDTLRKVYLQGEAFFDVVRNPSKPFVVFTADVATEVLGTSFRVKGNEIDNQVIVSVKTGKVSVYSVKDEQADVRRSENYVILLPNQQATYLSEENHFEKQIVDSPQIVEPSVTEDSFVFDEAPIATVFEKIQRAYGVEIEYDRAKMNNCFITAPLGSEPLLEKIKIVCQTIGASYEVVDGRIVITSAGCESTVSENLK